MSTVEIYHINFHTHRRRPIFLDDDLAMALDASLADITARHRILTLARAVMPTHVHVVVVSFPDQPRDRIVQLLKGTSARAFNLCNPEIAADIGGHLWQDGYDWVLVETHRQVEATLAYVAANRPRIGLPPLPDGRPME